MSDQRTRQPAGSPTGGQFATEARTEAGTSIVQGPGRGFPDGEMRMRVFDIDGQFGPLVGYDDTRRWNGFAQPWLTEESLRAVKGATRDWAEVNAEVEWLDDGPDGVWRLHTVDGDPVELERAVNVGPHLETLHRLEGWCWDSAEISAPDEDEQSAWAYEDAPHRRPHPTASFTVDGLTVRPTATRSEYTLFVTDTDGSVWRVAGTHAWEDGDVAGELRGDPSGPPADPDRTARVRAAAVAAAPFLLPHMRRPG